MNGWRSWSPKFWRANTLLTIICIYSGTSSISFSVLSQVLHNTSKVKSNRIFLSIGTSAFGEWPKGVPVNWSPLSTWRKPRRGERISFCNWLSQPISPRTCRVIQMLQIAIRLTSFFSIRKSTMIDVQKYWNLSMWNLDKVETVNRAWSERNEG